MQSVFTQKHTGLFKESISNIVQQFKRTAVCALCVYYKSAWTMCIDSGFSPCSHLHYTIVSGFHAVLPEAPKITTTQYYNIDFWPCPVHTQISPESLNLLLTLRTINRWNPQILCDFMFRSIILKILRFKFFYFSSQVISSHHNHHDSRHTHELKKP